MCLIVSKVKFEQNDYLWHWANVKCIFFYLLSDFAYYFLSILFKNHISRKLQCFGMIVSTKGIDQVLKIYMLSLSDILFSQKYHCYGTWQKCYGIDL